MTFENLLLQPERLPSEEAEEDGFVNLFQNSVLQGVEDPLEAAESAGKGKISGFIDLIDLAGQATPPMGASGYLMDKFGLTKYLDEKQQSLQETSKNEGFFKAGELLDVPWKTLGGLATIFPAGVKGIHTFNPDTINQGFRGGAFEEIMKANKLSPDVKDMDLIANPTKRQFDEFAHEELLSEDTSKKFRMLRDERGNLLIFDAKIIHSQASNPLDVDHVNNPFRHETYTKEEILKALDDPKELKKLEHIPYKNPQRMKDRRDAPATIFNAVKGLFAR